MVGSSPTRVIFILTNYLDYNENIYHITTAISVRRIIHLFLLCRLGYYLAMGYLVNLVRDGAMLRAILLFLIFKNLQMY